MTIAKEKVAKEKIVKRLITAGLILVLLVGSVWGLSWIYLARRVPIAYASPEQQFNYGSAGMEQVVSVPFWIWIILPRLFPEQLPGPGGYASLKMNWKAGEEVPVGLTKQVIGFPQVSINCAACHHAIVSDNGSNHLMLTGTTPTFDLQGYINFLRQSAADPRFSSDYLLNNLRDVYKLGWLKQNFYRFIIIPQSKQALTQLKDVPDLLKSHPDWVEASQNDQSVQFESNTTQ